ncbi:MAG: PEP-CTERM sorting domain-containing protein [Nitrosospira sp.]
MSRRRPDGRYACIRGFEFYTGDWRACTDPVVGRVPEPGSLALLGIGLLGFVAASRRK